MSQSTAPQPIVVKAGPVSICLFAVPDPITTVPVGMPVEIYTEDAFEGTCTAQIRRDGMSCWGGRGRPLEGGRRRPRTSLRSYEHRRPRERGRPNPVVSHAFGTWKPRQGPVCSVSRS
jgi:hypothetical protein